MTKTIADQFRALCQRAEARAEKTYQRKLASENERHDRRVFELAAERDVELAKARAALRAVEGEQPTPNLARVRCDGDHAPPPCEDAECWRKDPPEPAFSAQPPDDADAIPAAMREPFRPKHMREQPR